MTTVPTTVIDPTYKYRRLEPVPDDDELAQFYESRYYDLIRRGQRASRTAHLLAGGEEAERERRWLHSTLFRDIHETLTDLRTSQGTLLEVGCGTGDLLEYMSETGWQVLGLEVAPDATEVCRAKGLDVLQSSITDFVEGGTVVDVVVMIHILEHVPDPVAFLSHARNCLPMGGHIVVEVPNDFNSLQHAAVQTLGLKPWWIVEPDHINYFDFESLTRLLQGVGFDPVWRASSFPMEQFLLMGDDYISDPSLGPVCHERRVAFEMALDPATRRRLASLWADAGLGRTCIFIGEKC